MDLHLLERSTAVEHIFGRPIGCSEPFQVTQTNLESHTGIKQNQFNIKCLYRYIFRKENYFSITINIDTNTWKIDNNTYMYNKTNFPPYGLEPPD